MRLWRSGIVWSVLGFIGSLGHLAFSIVIGHRLSKAEYGYSSTILTYIALLGLPLSMVSTSLVHYIAHFRGRNDEARLQGLLAGCQIFLFKATIAGSVLALVLADPLARFFGFRTSLMLLALVSLLVNVWSGLAVALCQGMAWFKRIALIGVLAAGMKFLFVWILTQRIATAEMALTAVTLSLLANLSLLYWWKDIFRHGAERISPWNREFLHFLLVTGAYVAGNYFFLSGDAMVAQKFFSGDALGEYQYAGRWASNLPIVMLPLLNVMFTSRSGRREAEALSDQRILLSLYGVGLGCGAAAMIVLRSFLVQLITGHPNAHAAGMLIPYTITMAFVGLGQAIAMWSLASRWFTPAVFYGVFGVVYWSALMMLGHDPASLLRVMPVGAGAAFCLLLLLWLWNARDRLPGSAAA